MTQPDAANGRTLTFERIVQWADSDPAGRINAPRAFDFANEAIEGFLRQELGLSFLELLRERALGAPVVHARCNFVAPLFEGEAVTLTLSIERLGRSSIAWRVDATHQGNGAPVFHVEMVSSIIDMSTGRATAIPPAFRTAMEPFVAGRVPPVGQRVHPT